MKKERFFLLIIVLAIIDQLIKLFIILNKEKLPMILINNVLEIVYCENRGMAFGVGTGMTQIISIVTAIIMAMIVMVIYKNYSKINSKLLIGVVLLISGGLGNFLDRAFRLYVVDFIYVRLINFPVFNFADICVVIGVITICTSIIINRGEKIGEDNSQK